MNRHMFRLAPQLNGSISWGRDPVGDTALIGYRLCRCDMAGALHFEGLNIHPKHSRRDVAIALRAARHGLRDRVDFMQVTVEAGADEPTNSV